MVIYQVIDNVKTSLIFPTSPTLLYAESHFLKNTENIYQTKNIRKPIARKMDLQNPLVDIKLGRQGATVLHWFPGGGQNSSVPPTGPSQP